MCRFLKLGIVLAVVAFVVWGSTAASAAPILEYTFNETGTTAPSTGSDSTPVTLLETLGNPADLHSVPSAGVTGGNADRGFDNSASSMGAAGGVASQGDLDAIDGLTSFTIATWYKQTDNKSGYPRLAYHHGSGAGFQIEAPTVGSAGETRIIIDGDYNDGNRSPAGSFPDAVDTWVFFAFTYDGTQSTDNAKFYRGFRTNPEAAGVDSGFVADVTLVSTHSIDEGALGDNDVGLFFGNRQDRQRAFDGLIDNFRLFGSKTSGDASGTLSLAELETVRAGDVPQPITVTYQTASWVDDSVPSIEIATSLNDSSEQNINASRQNAHSFTTTEPFLLDKIWINYEQVQAAGVESMVEIRLFEVDDANAENLPDDPTNLFSEMQYHLVPDSIPDPGFAVFDVENVHLKANTSYVFQFIPTGFPYKWRRSADAYSGGDYYRVDADPDRQGYDMIFAVQGVPEPSTIILLAAGLIGLGLAGIRTRRHGAGGPRRA